MDDARALLNSLMGPGRDVKKDKSKVGDTFLDKTVCKRHLIGLCVTDSADNYFKGKECNKRGIQECNLIHSDATRAEFEKHPESEKYRARYESDYLAFLEKVIADADAIVRREKQLAKPLAPVLKLKDTAQAEVTRWEEEIVELTKQAEDYADKDDFAKSRECVEKARLTQKQLDLKKESCTYMCGEEVCEVCGLRFIVGDSREDKTNSETHKNSRMHRGYALVREKVEEMRKKVAEREVKVERVDRKGSSAEDRGKRKSRSGSRRKRSASPRGGGGGRKYRSRSRSRRRRERSNSRGRRRR
mmetsp:Transcript_104795/g.223983  ORF Transcript_104795/g.223983 Transcript_104795/m.223983 type:complete len:302 (+) Transcript_104795:108-1013(+)